jgi:hypothetical protein
VERGARYIAKSACLASVETWVQPLLPKNPTKIGKKKKRKIYLTWIKNHYCVQWHMPEIPAAQEGEAGKFQSAWATQ